VVQFNQVLGSLTFLCKVVWTTTIMAFKSLAFSLSLSFGSGLILAVVFNFHEFTKILLMVVRPIDFCFTLHIVVKFWQRSSTNRTLVMIL
jgi:hypothetical protein